MRYMIGQSKSNILTRVSFALDVFIILIVGGIIGVWLAFQIITSYIEISIIPADGRGLVLTKEQK